MSQIYKLWIYARIGSNREFELTLYVYCHLDKFSAVFKFIIEEKYLTSVINILKRNFDFLEKKKQKS